MVKQIAIVWESVRCGEACQMFLEPVDIHLFQKCVHSMFPEMCSFWHLTNAAAAAAGVGVVPWGLRVSGLSVGVHRLITMSLGNFGAV